MSWWKKLFKKAGGDTDVGPPAAGGCDHGAIQLRQGTAEFEWFIARSELEISKNLPHGASHLANLLSFDPGRPEWVELLENYLAAAGPDPEALIPRADKLYYSTEAMRAYIWQKRGQLEEAIDLLVQVTQAKTEARYLEAWALGWLEPAGAVEYLTEPLGLRLFALVLNRFPEAHQMPLPRLREVQRWARLCERFTTAHPGGGMNLMIRVGLLRRAALFEQAEQIARSALDRAPDWHTATALGLVLRHKGDSAGAEEAFRLALKLDPTDNSARLEAGDMYFLKEQWEPALRWYEEALTKDRQQPWAGASALYCRWQLTNEEPYLQQLVDLAKKQNQRAHALCQKVFWGRLPEPTDASANLVRQFRTMILEDAAKAPTGEARMAVTSLEAPSNFLAFRLEMEGLKHNLGVKVETNRVPVPDPREPIGEVKYLLWKYEGTTASPALPPPAKDVAQRIARLASAPFDEQANWASASRVAEVIGPDRVGEILAVMVHPPPVPEGMSALTWLPRVQHEAAQVAAQVDQGWEGSKRREALLSVLHGPSDWTTAAAIRALAQLAQENEVIAPDVHDAFQKLADHQPDAYCCWEHTLYSYWRRLPHLFPNEREELEKKLRKIEERDKQTE
jgi:tetratricopeptide (TPR) repeat protein